MNREVRVSAPGQGGTLTFTVTGDPEYLQRMETLMRQSVDYELRKIRAEREQAGIPAPTKPCGCGE